MELELSQLPVLAGTVATTIFVGSYLPMLARAVRTRDLSSYSRASLVLANVGNLVQTAYVLTLPVGPIWGLHAFYLLASLMMLGLHLHTQREARHPVRRSSSWLRVSRRGRRQHPSARARTAQLSGRSRSRLDSPRKIVTE